MQEYFLFRLLGCWISSSSSSWEDPSPGGLRDSPTVLGAGGEDSDELHTGSLFESSCSSCWLDNDADICEDDASIDRLVDSKLLEKDDNDDLLLWLFNSAALDWFDVSSLPGVGETVVEARSVRLVDMSGATWVNSRDLTDRSKTWVKLGPYMNKKRPIQTIYKFNSLILLDSFALLAIDLLAMVPVGVLDSSGSADSFCRVCTADLTAIFKETISLYSLIQTIDADLYLLFCGSVSCSFSASCCCWSILSLSPPTSLADGIELEAAMVTSVAKDSVVGGGWRGSSFCLADLAAMAAEI